MRTGADLTEGTDYTYSVTDLRMEYEIINEPSMSLDVKRQYDFGVVVPFKRYIKYRFEEINNNDSVINLKISASCKSLSYVLIFAIEPNDLKDWSRKRVFKNLDIKSVNIAVEGKPNQLYISGLTTALRAVPKESTRHSSSKRTMLDLGMLNISRSD